MSSLSIGSNKKENDSIQRGLKAPSVSESQYSKYVLANCVNFRSRQTASLASSKGAFL